MKRFYSEISDEKNEEETKVYNFVVLLPDGTHVGLTLKQPGYEIKINEFLELVRVEHKRILKKFDHSKPGRKIFWFSGRFYLKDTSGHIFRRRILFSRFEPTSTRYHILTLYDGEDEITESYDDQMDSVEWKDQLGRLNLKVPSTIDLVSPQLRHQLHINGMNIRLGRCHGTTTAGVVGPTFVIIASDGMLSRPLNSSGRHYIRTRFNWCKLHEVSDYCGAYAGGRNYEDVIDKYLSSSRKKGGINTFDQLQDALKSNTTSEFCYVFGGFNKYKGELKPEIRYFERSKENGRRTWHKVIVKNKSGSFITGGDGGEFATRVLNKMPTGGDLTEEVALRYLRAAFAYASICNKYTGGEFYYRIITSKGIGKCESDKTVNYDGRIKIIPQGVRILPKMWEDEEDDILSGMVTNFCHLSTGQMTDWIYGRNMPKGHWVSWLAESGNVSRLAESGNESDTSVDFSEDQLTEVLKLEDDKDVRKQMFKKDKSTCIEEEDEEEDSDLNMTLETILTSVRNKKRKGTTSPV